MRALIAGACALAACSAAPTTSSTQANDLGVADLPVTMTGITAGTFDQAMDHAAGAAPGTFAQRYWVSTAFASGPDAPVILVLGGESACGPAYVSVFGDIAKRLGASVVALEHRFYGQSIPSTGKQTLTIANALADAAAFEAYAKTSLGLGGRWIVAGVSYAGVLAAFYRAQHPELVVGAYASSPPINVVESFTDYDRISAETLGPTCDALVKSVLTSVQAAEDDPAQKLAAAMPVSNTAGDAVQNGVYARLCAALEEHADDPAAGLAGYENPPLGPGPAPEAPWAYQQCTEVGFFKLPNPDRDVTTMSDLMTIDYSHAYCTKNYGVLPNVAATRATYVQPILDGHASNIFVVNGSADPWSALSFTDQATAPAGITTKLVALGWHGSDFANLTPTSALGVFEAHAQFHDLAVAWLASP